MSVIDLAFVGLGTARHGSDLDVTDQGQEGLEPPSQVALGDLEVIAVEHQLDVAALGTFLPCYLFTVIPAPYFKRYGKLPSLVAFVDGVTAAAIGAITGAAIVLAKRSIVDVPSAILAVITLLLLWKLKKLQEPVIVAGAAIVGLIAYPLLHG